ncbi:MAG: TonB family protein [Myxococcota bacterium]|jgi:TonB family protein
MSSVVQRSVAISAALSVGFAAGRLSAPAPPPASGVVVRGAPILLGAIPRSDIDGVVGRNMTAVESAYSEALTQRLDTAGDLVVKLKIGSDGKVENASVKSSSVDCPPCEAAALKTLAALAFPAPARGTAIVHYPFHFFPE